MRLILINFIEVSGFFLLSCAGLIKAVTGYAFKYPTEVIAIKRPNMPVLHINGLQGFEPFSLPKIQHPRGPECRLRSPHLQVVQSRPSLLLSQTCHQKRKFCTHIRPIPCLA